MLGKIVVFPPVSNTNKGFCVYWFHFMKNTLRQDLTPFCIWLNRFVHARETRFTDWWSSTIYIPYAKRHIKSPQIPNIVTLFHRIFYKEILQQINQIKSGLVILHTSQPTRDGCIPQSLRIYALRKSSAMPFRAALIPTSRFPLLKWL